MKKSLPTGINANVMIETSSIEDDVVSKIAINDIVKFAQKECEADDPTKPLVFYKENTTYIHPYLKEMLNALMGLSKQYEKSKRKPKKPKARNKLWS